MARKTLMTPWAMEVQPHSRAFGVGRALLIVACLLVFGNSFRADAQTAQSAVLYNKSLKGQGDLAVIDNTYCHLAYEAQGYVVGNVSSAGVCDAAVAPVGDLPAHVRMEVTVFLQKGDTDTNFGLYFGFGGGDAQAHYHLSLNSNGKFSVTFLTGGKRVYPFPVRSDPSVKQGFNTPNRLAVEIMGPRARFFINGKEVGSILARTSIVGAMGFGTDGNGAEAVFSDLVVTDLAPGTPSGATTTSGAATTTSTAGQSSGETLILDDDFVTNHNWPVNENGKPCATTYGTDGLTMKDSDEKSFCLLPLAKTGVLPSHVRIELTVTLLDGAKDSDYGFSFGGHKSGSDYFFYLLGADANGSYDVSRHTATWTDVKPWTRDTTVLPGYAVANTLAVEIHGAKFTYSVNGVVKGSADAAEDLAGEFGLYLNAPGMNAKYTHLRIYDLGQ